MRRTPVTATVRLAFILAVSTGCATARPSDEVSATIRFLQIRHQEAEPFISRPVLEPPEQI